MPPHLPRFWCGAHVALKGTDFVYAGAVGAGPSGRGGSWRGGHCAHCPRRRRAFIGKLRYLLMYIAQGAMTDAMRDFRDRDDKQRVDQDHLLWT